MIMFYCWRTLKDHRDSVRLLSHVLPSKISGDGSTYVYDVDDSSEGSADIKTAKNTKKRRSDQGAAMAAALNLAIKENGLGNGGKRAKSEIEVAASVALKEKEGLFLEAQMKAAEAQMKVAEAQTNNAKALMFKGIAESDLFTDEERAKARRSWLELAGF